MSKTLVQYLQALAFPYLVWHSSVGENGFVPLGSRENTDGRTCTLRCVTRALCWVLLLLPRTSTSSREQAPHALPVPLNVAPRHKQKPHVPEEKSSEICLKHISFQKHHDPVTNDNAAACVPPSPESLRAVSVPACFPGRTHRRTRTPG